jgi:GntR family transcriptional regulator
VRRDETPAKTQIFQFKLDSASGVPVYRQLMDQVRTGLASGTLAPGDQLPTVRQVAVDLAINPNTVLRAYRELEIRGTLDSQQGTGTFIADRKIQPDETERRRILEQFVNDVVSRAGAGGFTLRELAEELNDRVSESDERRK